MSEVQKWNNETNNWEICTNFDQPPKAAEPIFRHRLHKNAYPPHVSECGRYRTDMKNSFFNVGDMIDDRIPTNNAGAGIIIEKQLVTINIPYTFKVMEADKKSYSEHPICCWKYLVDFPGSSNKGCFRKGQIWLWEFPMRELIDNGDIKIHYPIK